MVLLLQMLLDFPKTDINLKSDGGTTPLMDAVKSTNMYMVKQLVKKSADISLTDYEGTVHVVCIVCAYYGIAILSHFMCFQKQILYIIVVIPNEVLIKRKRIYFITIFPPNPPHRSHGCPLGSHDRTRGGAEATDSTGPAHHQGCSG